ncbi:ribonuclease domain-containing protein [Anaerococcus sp. AGMB09787]|uniref:ribonuclease domain-containing protein n=1 Tax=Anaerococcus sp. AGMB09787 TaxID=2922869 RepID=UPI001FAF4947|nr:ribonuclease domain-containing protein [Anaerococcus sp. AGMB09787]
MKVKKHIFYLLTSIILTLTGCLPTNQSVDTPPPHAQVESKIEENEAYYSLEDVTSYLIEYEKLPKNYLTKKEALDLGWEPSEGNLWDVTDKGVIGGDYFGNFEGSLPDGDYKEADVNYDGGRRGAERIVYDEDLNIYYTEDHYDSFERIN